MKEALFYNRFSLNDRHRYRVKWGTPLFLERESRAETHEACGGAERKTGTGKLSISALFTGN
jgi:hypothetical protein